MTGRPSGPGAVPEGAATPGGKRLGVILCSCGGTLFTAVEGKRIASALRRGAGGEEPARPVVVARAAACPGRARSGAFRRRKIDGLVFAGCSLLGRADLREGLASGAGLIPGAVRGVDLREPAFRRPSGGLAAGEAAEAIRRALRALRLQPVFARKRIPLAPGVLVLGGGPAGIEAASRLQALGHPVTVVAGEPEERIASTAVAGLARSVRLLAGSRLRNLEGQVGAFTARVQTQAGEVAVSAGAVIVAGSEEELPAAAGRVPADGPLTLPLAGLEEAVAALPRRAGTRSVGILLDLELDESRASSERALRLALRLQRRERVQVHLFCRDVQVAALPLEELYGEARQAGVEIVKYAGAPRLSPGAQGVAVRVQDQVLGEPLELRCDLLGVSPGGTAGSGARALAEITGVSTDALGRLQQNNVRLFPEKTNRPGVFVAGPGRGEDYPPQAVREARAAALEAHRLLAPGELEVELSNAVVDADRCALCLTCVRSCPFRAMRVNAEKGAAESIPEVCRKCGLCAGECPAKAIELPAYSDRILLGQMR